MIEIRGLVKRYGEQLAVDGIDLDVQAGEVLGFVGPNGAGKTSTFKIIATLAWPDAGTVKVAGFDVLEDTRAVRRSLGFMPDSFGGYNNFSVAEYLDYFGALYGLDRRHRRARAAAVLELTDLGIKIDAPVRGLSKGMKQRLCLAKTLLHDPRVLVLDEPASGLDPRARVEMRELLLELRRMQKTILLSSHILPELESLCDRVAFIETGKIVAVGTLEEIARQLRRQAVVHVAVHEELERARTVLLGLPQVLAIKVVQIRGLDVLEISSDAETFQAGMIPGALASAGLALRYYQEETHDLEAIFLAVTRGDVA